MLKSPGIISIMLVIFISCLACTSNRIPCPNFNGQKTKPAKFRKIYTKGLKQHKSINLQWTKTNSKKDSASVLMLANQKSDLTSDLKSSNLKLTTNQIKINIKLRALSKAIDTSSILVKLKRDTIPKKKNEVKSQRKTKDPRKLSSWAVAGFVTSIVGIVFFPLSILAIIFSAVGLKEIKKDPDLKGHELAKAGLIIGIVITALAVVAIAFVLILLNGLSI